jgi:hypothetical protein
MAMIAQYPQSLALAMTAQTSAALDLLVTITLPTTPRMITVFQFANMIA